MAKIIWLTGISGAGKTTLGELLLADLKQANLQAVLLDGDVVRDFFEHDLGYERKDRIQNVKRIAFAAHLLSQNGITVIVANIAPFVEVRDFVRRKLGASYIQIYLRSSLETVSRRDVKGHYQKNKAGQLSHVIGVDDAYEVPRNPDLVVDTENIPVHQSHQTIFSYLSKKLELN